MEISAKLKREYTQHMEKLGMTREAWVVFLISSLLQFIWGCETCFISINMDSLAKYSNISKSITSISLCLMFTMMGFGSLIVGFSTRYLGRIVTLLYSTLFYFIFTISCSVFITHLEFYYTLVLRCLSNICSGIFNIVIINLLSEFLPIKNRSLILMINSGFYNVGNLFLIILNFYYDGMSLSHTSSSAHLFHATNWKMINLITSFSGIIAFLMILFFTSESPLFLLNKNREEEAFIIIEQMGKSVLSHDQKHKIRTSVVEKKVYSLKSSYRELFLPQYFSLTIYSLFICSIGYFNMIGISYLVPKTINELGVSTTYNLSYYSQLFIYAILQLPNGVLGGLMTESQFFGRKRTIWISSVVCGVFYFISYFWPKFMCFYAGEIMLFNSIAYGCAFIYVTEAFPTNIRDQAQSLIQFFSFVLGSWSPFLVTYFTGQNIIFNFIILGVSCFICAFITFLLPVETKSRPLDEDF